LNNGKKILFISYDGMTDPLGQSQVIPYLQGLAKTGYSIFLLSCEKKQVFKQNKPVVDKMLEGYNIKWVPLDYTKKPPVLSTLLDILKLRNAAKKIHQENKLDMVHTRPGIPALVGLWMKKKMGIKFLNDIREFYADSRVEGGMWNTNNPVYKAVYKFFRSKEAEAVLKSDGIVCLTYAAEKIIKEWKEYRKEIPLQVIPCCADLGLFDPGKMTEAEKSSLRSELNMSKDDLVISYLGSIGGWYLVDEMMEFCKVLTDKIPSSKILFISPHRHETIRMAAAAHWINPSRVIIKNASRLEVPKLLSLSQYSVFFIKSCYSKQSSSPTKHGEIMAMGIPLITNSGVGDVEMIVNRYNAGMVIHEFNNREFGETAEKIASNLNFNTDNIRQGAEEFYSLEKAIEKYIAVYNKILNQ
jgi:glycosyltransferase involved in cell wall biosynthesis